MTNFVNEYRYGIYRWSRSLPLGAAATLQHWQRVKKVIYNFEKETLPNDELPFLKEMRKQKWSLVRSNENLIVFLFIVQSHIMTAGEEEEVNKELELPHLPDMLFIHNRLRCSHASGFQIEVQHFVKVFFASGVGFPLYPELFATLWHNEPAAHQDHCGRCRIRTRDFWPRSLVHYQWATTSSEEVVWWYNIP